MSDHGNIFSAFHHLGRLGPRSPPSLDRQVGDMFAPFIDFYAFPSESSASASSSRESAEHLNLFSKFEGLESVSPTPRKIGFDDAPTLGELAHIDPELAEELVDQSDSESDKDSISEVTLNPVVAMPCSPSSQKPLFKEEKVAIERAAKRTDLSMKISVERQNLMCIQANFRCNCTSTNCIGDIGPKQALRFRQAFWGDFGSKQYPSTSERRQRMRMLLETAFAKGELLQRGTFIFQIENVIVCEAGMLTMLGFDASAKSKMWRDIKSRVQRCILEVVKDDSVAIRGKYQRYRCRVFIISFIQRECDKLPHKLVAVVPYVYIKDFWRDYEYGARLLLRSSVLESTDIACYETFKRAFEELKKENKVTLMRRVGGFNTCEICNNCSDLLRDGRNGMCQAGRDIIISYRRAHLTQQAAERHHMEQCIETCRRQSRNGQPTALFIDPDGMTERKTVTPVNRTGDAGRTSNKTDQKNVQNRVIGTQVVCGPLDKFFLYVLDDFIPKGAIAVVEVVRQTLKDVNDYLASNGWVMPRTLYIHADNSGENKNQYMLTYLSALVELGYFDTIYLNFLVVGHTHGPNDQCFSVLGRKIYVSRFIGSPMALDVLLANAHSRPEDRPYLVKRIKVAHDIKTALDPFINRAIHTYQFPHCFIFERVEGKAIMRYKLFSTFDEWLPRAPTSHTSSQEGHIIVPEHMAVGGQRNFLSQAGLDSARLADSTDADRNFLTNFQAMRATLLNLDQHSDIEMLARLSAQAEGADEVLPEHFDKAAVEHKLSKASRHNEGYIMWLKDPENKLKDIKPLPLAASKPLAIGAAKKHWDVARYMLRQVEIGVIGVNKKPGATYDNNYFVPVDKKKQLLPEELRYYELRATSQEVPLRFYQLDINATPAWTFLPEPSIASRASFTIHDRIQRESEEDAVLADIERNANIALVRPSHRFEPGQEILSRVGRSTNDEVGPLDLTKLAASVDKKGYKVAELKNYCLLEGLAISGSKPQLRERLMIAKGLIPQPANTITAPAVAPRQQQQERGGTRLSPASRRTWASRVIQQVSSQAQPYSAAETTAPAVLGVNTDLSGYQSSEPESDSDIPLPVVAPVPASRKRRK